MAQSILSFIQQKVEINDVTDVLYTGIEQDVDGNYVREFRVQGTAPEGQTSSPQVFVLRLKSPIKTNLELTTPSLQV